MKKILIMDNEEAIRLLFTEELCDEGYEIYNSDDYTTFLDTVEHYMPDLLIFDVRAGNLNDLNLLRDIRDAGHTLPIILCSSCPVLYDAMQSRDADSYIIKSADLSELKSRVKKALAGETHQYRQSPLRDSL